MMDNILDDTYLINYYIKYDYCIDMNGNTLINSKIIKVDN